jgi:hypothetical protein
MDKQRIKQVNTRVTEEEFEAIRRHCFDAKIKCSSFIRSVILTSLGFGISDGENKV